MDTETTEKMKKMKDMLDSIFTTINTWYENKSLLELP